MSSGDLYINMGALAKIFKIWSYLRFFFIPWYRNVQYMIIVLVSFLQEYFTHSIYFITEPLFLFHEQ